MKTSFILRRISVYRTLLFSLPTACFLLVSLLNEECRLPCLYNAVGYLLQDFGFRANPAFNNNLLILFGPVLTLLLILFLVLHNHAETTSKRIDCRFAIAENWKNLAVVLLGPSALFILYTNFLTEYY